MVDREKMREFAKLKDQIYWIAVREIEKYYSSPKKKWETQFINTPEINEMLEIFEIIEITFDVYCKYMKKANLLNLKRCYDNYLPDLIRYDQNFYESKEKIKGDTNYFCYLFILREIVSEAILSGYAEGMAYLDFINELSEEYEISMSNDSKKNLATSFKVYISNCNQKKEDFFRNIGSIWLTHKGVEGKNKNGGAVLVPPIMLYEKAEFEFEFLVREQYRTNDGEKIKIKEKLEQIRKQKLEAILKEVFQNEEIDFKNCCKEYVSLLAKPIVKMSDDELKTYLKYMKCKHDFIKRYSSSEFVNIAVFRLYYELDYERVWMNIFPNIELDNTDFFVISSCVSRAIEVFSDDIGKSWKGAIKLLNYICKVFSLFKESVYIEKFDDLLLESDQNLCIYKKICESTRRFNRKESINILKEKFLGKLDTIDRLSDFINMVILEESIIAGIDDQNNERKYWMPSQEYLSSLAQAMVAVCLFLNECYTKADKTVEDKFDIKKEFNSLSEVLNSNGISLDTGYFTKSYLNTNQKLKSKSYVDYFKKCDDTKYVRLYFMIEKELKENGKLPDVPGLFVQNYMNTIFNRREPEEQKIQKEYIRAEEIEEIVLANLVCCMNDNFIYQDIESIYNLKEKLDKILNKYELQDIC